jgi:hypothetical protein
MLLFKNRKIIKINSRIDFTLVLNDLGFLKKYLKIDSHFSLIYTFKMILFKQLFFLKKFSNTKDFFFKNLMLHHWLGSQERFGIKSPQNM